MTDSGVGPDDERTGEFLADLVEAEGIDAAADHLLDFPAVLVAVPRTAVVIARVVEEFRPETSARLLEAAAAVAEQAGDWPRAGEW